MPVTPVVTDVGASSQPDTAVYPAKSRCANEVWLTESVHESSNSGKFSIKTKHVKKLFKVLYLLTCLCDNNSSNCNKHVLS